MRVLLTILLLTSFDICFSQNNRTAPAALSNPKKNTGKNFHKYRFGFKGGYNHSVVNGKELNGAKTGYIGDELYGGFFSDILLNDKLNIGNDLLFSWTDSYHFIELPVHIKYKFSAKWIGFAGPKIDYIADDPLKDGYKFKKTGISGELGAQYNITNSFFAEARYARSFTGQITDLLLDINHGKRNTFRAGLGIKF
jgi:hypothetical protein